MCASHSHARRASALPALLPSFLALPRLLAPPLLALLLALGALPSPAGAKAVIVDEQWIAPDFASRNITKIAVLPAVTFDGFPTTHAISNAFFNRFRTDGHRWLPPSSAFARFGVNGLQRDSMLRAIGLQVRRAGRADPATSARLARLLEVDALVFLRVDRWEVVRQASDETTIEVRAEMVDASGAPIWRTTGRSRIFGQTQRSEIMLPAAPKGDKIIQTAAQAGGGGGGSSGGSGGSGSAAGSGGINAGGSASTSGPSSGSSGSSGSSSMPTYITRIQHSVTSQEDLMMLSPLDGPGTGPAPFDRAAQALVEAWAPLLPRGTAVVSARPDSSREAPRR